MGYYLIQVDTLYYNVADKQINLSLNFSTFLTFSLAKTDTQNIMKLNLKLFR